MAVLRPCVCTTLYRYTANPKTRHLSNIEESDHQNRSWCENTGLLIHACNTEYVPLQYATITSMWPSKVRLMSRSLEFDPKPFSEDPKMLIVIFTSEYKKVLYLYSSSKAVDNRCSCVRSNTCYAQST